MKNKNTNIPKLNTNANVSHKTNFVFIALGSGLYYNRQKRLLQVIDISYLSTLRLVSFTSLNF